MIYKYLFECRMSSCNDYMTIYYRILTDIEKPNTRTEYVWEKAYKYFKEYAKERGLEVGSITMFQKEGYN